jgi:hypothetical protein
MEVFFSIAELKILLKYDAECCDILYDEALASFSLEHVPDPDIRFLVDVDSPIPATDSCKKLFTSTPAGLWTVFEDEESGHYVISLQNVERSLDPFRVVKANRNLSDFVIYSKPNQYNQVYPLEYPLPDLAVSGYANINRIGIILHSACIMFNNKAYLFAGVSGSGKSTISLLWQKDNDAEVLTDERVLIRQFHDGIWGFGTPWHGTEKIHKNRGASIDKIFFIKHGNENKATLLRKLDAANRLMVRCFPAFWNTEGMKFALDFCLMIAEKVQCYELEFVNKPSVISYVKGFCD